MKIKEINEKELIFNNEYKLTYYHSQDCCEHVYADFETLKSYNISTITGEIINIKEIEFPEHIEKMIEGIKNCGFNMISEIGEKFFVPCYNFQNGYYGSDLELNLTHDNITETIDISDFVEDNIE